MVTPPDDATLVAGLASVQATLQATLSEYGPRFDRLEHKLDAHVAHIDERIDSVYPKLAQLEEKSNGQQREIDKLEDQVALLHGRIWKLVIGGVTLAIGIIGDAIWAGWVHPR